MEGTREQPNCGRKVFYSSSQAPSGLGLGLGPGIAEQSLPLSPLPPPTYSGFSLSRFCSSSRARVRSRSFTSWTPQ